MKHNILVVDDSYYMRTILRNILEDNGFKVIAEAANGTSAIKNSTDHMPDLITLDLILPDNTGLDVLKAIKRDRPEVKVVIVSAVGQEKIVKEAMALGAEAYVVKPFVEEKVIEIIKSILN